MITAINSENDYKAALHQIEELIDLNVKVGTPEGDRLNILTLLVQDYEQKRVESQNSRPDRSPPISDGANGTHSARLGTADREPEQGL